MAAVAHQPSYGRHARLHIEEWAWATLQLRGGAACRVQAMLKAAMRAVPLVADPEALEVLYEDADFLAVNKPAGVRSTPIHRYTGGSMVNRAVGYLGAPPFVVHRLDMNTSGVLLLVKTRAVVGGIQRQFRWAHRWCECQALASCRAVPVLPPGAAHHALQGPGGAGGGMCPHRDQRARGEAGI
jgi:23S rRNA-/tRNA-specific pseudouridylate synthase